MTRRPRRPDVPLSSRIAWLAMLATLSWLTAVDPVPAARRDSLELTHATVALPGSPATLLAPDLDGDGRRDLLAVVVYDEARTITEERVERLVSITTVIPALLRRRELRAWLATPGGFVGAGAIELPSSVLSLGVVDAGQAVLALTDDGIARVRWSGADAPALAIEPWIDERPTFAGAANFLSGFEWIDDLDRDGREELLVPTPDGLAVYVLPVEAGAPPRLLARIDVPGERRRVGAMARRRTPWPLRRDLDGDGLDDLVFLAEQTHVLLRRGDRFEPPYAEPDDCTGTRTALRRRAGDGTTVPVGRLTHLGDLDGDGRAEAVEVEIESRGDGMRAGMKDAKRPLVEYTVSQLDDGFVLASEPSQRFVAPGHGFDVGEGVPAAFSRFEDLDGDGRAELTTFTLDFSVFQVVRMLATKKIGIGVEFHVWRQDDEGRFREVGGLDLTEKLRFDLRKLELGRFGQFAGDFDGDGRREFVHLGRGRTVTIHRGAPGCRYPKKPDLAVTLEHAPQHVGLVRIEDLDGDGRADLRVTRIGEPQRDDGGSAPVVIDLYLSGGER